MPGSDVTEQHVRSFFAGHQVKVKRWEAGPGRKAIPDLRILEVRPGPRLNQWTYITAGAANAGLRKLEFLAIGDRASEMYVELLTMVAFYVIEQRLGMGHTIPIGRPLCAGSSCEHVYLLLPYVFGPELEVVRVASGATHILWVFPITGAEKKLLLESGLDAFDERLEAESVEYWSPLRSSVV